MATPGGDHHRLGYHPANLEHRACAVRSILDEPHTRKGDRTRAIGRKAAEPFISTKTLRRWIQTITESGLAAPT